MESEFNKGAAYSRDMIITKIIGMQNSLGNKESDKQYQILQKLLVGIECSMGKYCKRFIG